MKKIVAITFMLICNLLFAQNQEKRIERIKNLRIAFISNKLDLTTQEAERFWPVFNKFDDKQSMLLKQKRILMRKISSDNTSENTNLQLLKESEDLETNMQNNRRDYVKELQTVISAEKILTLKKTEDNFKKMLLKKFNQFKNDD